MMKERKGILWEKKDILSYPRKTFMGFSQMLVVLHVYGHAVCNTILHAIFFLLFFSYYRLNVAFHLILDILIHLNEN